MRRAAIDVGSNSVLLTVEEFVDGAWKSVIETTEVTGLGEGTKSTGLLGEEPMKRTLAGIARAYGGARDAGTTSVVAAATMAARIASNTPDFLHRAKAQGTPVFVLSGELEAQLGFLAVAEDPLFAGQGRVSIVDPGGHSTEIVTAERGASGWEVLLRRSYPVGTLGLRSDTLSGESPDFRALLRAVREIDDLIGLCYLPNQAGEVVVLGASGTNLVTIRDKLLRWDAAKVHGAWLDYEEVSKAAGWLSTMTDAERARVPGLEPGREGTIHIGALILERFLFALRVLGCRVSVRGWRHALIEHEGLVSGQDTR